jgi:hypothetical protein
MDLKEGVKKLYNDPVVQRIFRGAVGIGIAYGLQIAAASTNPTILLLAPVINGIGKWIRDKYKVPNIPI